MSTDSIKMRSSRPYLLAALYDWLVDSQCTPYLLVDATYSGVKVPEEFVDNGKIVLSIAPQAIRDWQLQPSYVSFHTLFSGVERDIYLPIAAILSIYAAENGQGMIFTAETLPDGGVEIDEPVKEGKPSFRLVD